MLKYNDSSAMSKFYFLIKFNLRDNSLLLSYKSKESEIYENEILSQLRLTAFTAQKM